MDMQDEGGLFLPSFHPPQHQNAQFIEQIKRNSDQNQGQGGEGADVGFQRDVWRHHHHA